MVAPIFKSPEQQQQFDADGFLKIELLTEKNVEDLKALFHQYFPDPSIDFYSSSYESDYSFKKEISDALAAIIKPNLDRVFDNYSCFGSAFLSKGNGPRSEMPMHQDWTIVDESKYVALNIWTPLQNTNNENGTLEVIKGSQKWHDCLRAPTLPFYYEGFQDKLKEKLISVPARATEAVVLNQAVIHYSKPNRTNEMRIAITTGIKSKEAPTIFHYWNKEEPDSIEQFKQSDDFLLQFSNFHRDIFARPQMGVSIGKIPFAKKVAAGEEVMQLFEQKKITLLQRLQSLIKGS